MCIRASFRRLFGRAAHLLDLGVHRLDEIGADLPRVLVRDPPHRRAQPLALLGRPPTPSRRTAPRRARGLSPAFTCPCPPAPPRASARTPRARSPSPPPPPSSG